MDCWVDGWMDDGRIDIYEGIADKRMDGLHMYIHISIPFAFYVRFFFAAISYFALFSFLSNVFFFLG